MSATHTDNNNHQTAKEHNAHGQHDRVEVPKDLPRPSGLVVTVLLAVFAVLLIALFFVGYVPHRKQLAEIREDAKEVAADLPVVDVASPKVTNTSNDLVLPADIRANQSTAIYARANGFLKKWYVDINDKVEAGQLLAEIDLPDIDAQLTSSKASLEQSKAAVTRAEADLKLAKTTLDRYLESQKSSPGSVTQQDLDAKQSAYEDAAAALKQAQANVGVAEADVKRYEVTQGFGKVAAPFSGIITARNYDVGALVSANGSGKELFSLAQTDTLRVYVNVPQNYSTQIVAGQPVTLKVRNYPDRDFKGVVSRSAGALDANTRTLPFELKFPNPDGALFAGMYGQVKLPIVQPQKVLVVPSSALVFNAAGLQVALVKDNKVHMQKVNVGRDLGTEIEVASGLSDADQVITNPGERLGEGVEVKLAQKAQTQTAQTNGSNAEQARAK